MAKRTQAGRGARRHRAGRQWPYLAGAALALSLVATVILLETASRDGNDGANAPVVVPTSRPSAVPTDGMVYGDPGATVTVTEYLDFQCPVCLRAGLTVLDEIVQRYVEAGQAKLEIKPIAILGDESVAATEAAHCAADQGLFWPYHDILFANQGEENDGGFSGNRLKDFAARQGLDATAFASCLDSGTYESLVRSNTEDAMEQGVEGTPTILVNGAKVETSVDAIAAAIEAVLGAG